MDSENTARVLEMPAVKAEREAKATKAEAKRAAKAERDAKEAEVETPAMTFDTVTEAATAAAKAYEAKLRAEAARTKVGKEFADRIKQAGDGLKEAVTEESDGDLAKHLTSIKNAQARGAKLKAETEEIAKEDDGAVGKAFRKLSRVKKERAEAKAGPAARVEKASEKFETVMASIRLQAKQLRLEL